MVFVSHPQISATARVAPVQQMTGVASFGVLVDDPGHRQYWCRPCAAVDPRVHAHANGRVLRIARRPADADCAGFTHAGPSRRYPWLPRGACRVAW